MAFSNVFHGVTVDMCMIWKEKKKKKRVPFLCNLVTTRFCMVLHDRPTDKWHLSRGVLLAALPYSQQSM